MDRTSIVISKDTAEKLRQLRRDMSSLIGEDMTLNSTIMALIAHWMTTDHPQPVA